MAGERRRRRWARFGGQRDPALPAGAARAFSRALGAVEAAKARLVAAVPVSGRVGGVPLAEALAGFEAGLAEARAAMSGWRHPPVEDVWSACDEGLAEAARRAERLRLEGSPGAYEELVADLDDLMAPLASFAAAVAAIRG